MVISTHPVDERVKAPGLRGVSKSESQVSRLCGEAPAERVQATRQALGEGPRRPSALHRARRDRRA
jgi:hypothetical protein